MKKLITGAIVAAALAVPATPAFAIHDPFVPAGDCANSPNAVGIPSGSKPAVIAHRDLSFVNNVVLTTHNKFALTTGPPCHH